LRYPSLILLALFVASVAHGADVAIDTQSVAPTAAQASGAVVVPMGDGFLAIWKEAVPVEPSYCFIEGLRAIRLDRDGHPRDGRSFVVAPGTYTMFIIAAESDGNDVYIAWTGTYDPAIHLTRVSGDVVTVLSDSVPIAGRCTMRVSNGKILFLSSRGELGDPLTVTLLDRTGAVVRSGVNVVEQAAFITGMDLVAVNGTFLFTWMSSDSHLRAASISPADVAANNVRITPADLGIMTNVYGIRLVSDGVHSMIFWVDYRSSKYGLRARSLSSTGTPLDAGPVTIGSVTPGSGPLAAIPVGDGYDVFFQDYVNEVSHPVFLRVSFDGAQQAVSRPAQPIAFAQNGGRTIAAWTENRFAMTGFYSPFAGYETVVAPLAADGSTGAGSVVSLDLAEQHVRKLVPMAGGSVALWTEGAPNERVVVSRLTTSGQPADGGLRLRESLFNQSNSAIATDGERLFVVWTEGDESKPQTLYGAIVLPGALSASVKPLAMDASGASDIAVVWNGQTFTVVYQRVRTGGFDFAALRADRSGNAVDPLPISLTPVRYYDENPRLSWNGSDYLLVWQSWYDPFTYTGEQCFSKPAPLPAELFAQRFSEAFAPSGNLIVLAVTPTYNDDLLDVQDDDVSFAGGTWLVLWRDGVASQSTKYLRIDANGNRLDPLNGRQLPGSYEHPLLISTTDGWTVAGREGYGTYGAGRGLAFGRIDINGLATALPTMPLSDTNAVEAVALAPAPLVAYKRSTSSAAYVGLLVQRSRAARH
jgi:hypothetical protein